ncbi:MAG: MerR family transcriptional regulator [Defluviitaleaceae bacterium]|nr:MerR family transcriptional regulator [Defluviitaleaceae bacterium]
MSTLIKIRDVSSKYNISARTLRYYEDMGLLISTRSEDYAYRLYDEINLVKLEQILILRKLNISVKDIKRVLTIDGSNVVLDVLGKKVENIDDEVALLYELKEIVLSFIKHIKQSDFSKESDVKRLFDKACEIEGNLVNINYDGNPGRADEQLAAETTSPVNINRLLEITEQLDKKVPGDMLNSVLDFGAFLQANDAVVNGAEVSYKGKPLCYMHLDNTTAEPGPWTIWTEGDYHSEHANFPIDEQTKEIAWSHVNICANFASDGKHCGCGSQPGHCKVIFGKTFDNVCNADMAFYIPNAIEVECAKKMLLTRKHHIDSEGKS